MFFFLLLNSLGIKVKYYLFFYNLVTRIILVEAVNMQLLFIKSVSQIQNS